MRWPGHTYASSCAIVKQLTYPILILFEDLSARSQRTNMDVILLLMFSPFFFPLGNFPLHAVFGYFKSNLWHQCPVLLILTMATSVIHWFVVLIGISCHGGILWDVAFVSHVDYHLSNIHLERKWPERRKEHKCGLTQTTKNRKSQKELLLYKVDERLTTGQATAPAFILYERCGRRSMGTRSKVDYVRRISIFCDIHICISNSVQCSEIFFGLLVLFKTFISNRNVYLFFKT